MVLCEYHSFIENYLHLTDTQSSRHKDSEDSVDESATKRIKHSPSNSMDYHKPFDMSAPTMFDFKSHGLLQQYGSNGMAFPGIHNPHLDRNNPLLMSFGARPQHPGIYCSLCISDILHFQQE